MRTRTKNKFFTILAVLIVSVVSAQENNRFYKTVEDYENKKFIEGYEIKINSLENNMGTEFLSYTKGKFTEKKRLSNLPSNLFSYTGMLCRSFKNHTYIVRNYGTFCYYSFYHSEQIQYYSIGLKGDVEKLTEEILMEHLAKHGLLEDYNKEKPSLTISTQRIPYYMEQIKVRVKYVDLMNQKADSFSPPPTIK